MNRLQSLKAMFDAVCAVNPEFRKTINDSASYGEIVRLVEDAYAALQAQRR